MKAKRSAAKAMDLKEAQRVVEAHREAEYAERVAAAQKYVGRCYRYRNSSSMSEKWWLYGRVERIDSIGWPQGLTFERFSGAGEIRIHHDRPIHVESGGWEEITEAEFWSQAARHLGMVEGLLLRK